MRAYCLPGKGRALDTVLVRGGWGGTQTWAPKPRHPSLCLCLCAHEQHQYLYARRSGMVVTQHSCGNSWLKPTAMLFSRDRPPPLRFPLPCGPKWMSPPCSLSIVPLTNSQNSDCSACSARRTHGQLGPAHLPSWHLAPLCPGGQTHRYPLISSTQVAPKAQGEDWHSLMSRKNGVRA